jgi:nucleoside-diphosphate-sugar epimerase
MQQEVSFMGGARNIVVTGGAGYLGSILVPELLAAGHSVTVLDSFMFRQMPFGHVCHVPGLSIVRGDAREAATLRPLVRKADVVIPLAALVGAPICDQDPTGAVTTNRDAISTLVGMLSTDQLIVTPISNSGYGIGEKGKYCTEETPLRPVSLYGRTKVEAETIALSHANSISLRLATVFGMSPRMRLDLLVNDFTYRAVFDRAVVLFEAHFKRNYIHVRDVARAFMHAMARSADMGGQAYNVGLSDANLSKLELCEAIARHVPGFVCTQSNIAEDPDKRDYIVSNAKIEATGFKPKFSLDDGIKELVKGYQMFARTAYGNV